MSEDKLTIRTGTTEMTDTMKRIGAFLLRVDWSVPIFLAVWWGLCPYIIYQLCKDASVPEEDLMQFVGMASFFMGFAFTACAFCAIGWVIEQVQYFMHRNDPDYAFERWKRENRK